MNRLAKIEQIIDKVEEEIVKSMDRNPSNSTRMYSLQAAGYVSIKKLLYPDEVEP